MGEEQKKFLRRWEFRSNDDDLDSSSNDSKSSGDPTLKKLQVVSSFAPRGDETSDYVRFQDKGNCDPSISGEVKCGKAQTRRRGKSNKNGNSAQTERKTGTTARKVVGRMISKASAQEHSALDDLKSYMSSLLKDLKVTRENLIVWMREEMQKLVAESSAGAPASEEKDGNFRREKGQLQHLCSSNENTKQQQRQFKEYEQVQHQQQQMKKIENVEMQHKPNVSESIPLLQNQNTFRYQTGVQDCSNVGMLEKFYQRRKSADTKNCIQARECQGDFSRPITQTEKKRQDILAFPDKAMSKSTPAEMNVEEQQPKSIVLAIKAQNCRNGTSRRSSRGKKRTNTSDDHNQIQLTEDKTDYSKAIVPITSIETEPNFAMSHVTNHGFDLSSLKPIPSRVGGAMNTGKSTSFLGSGSQQQGYFMGLQPEERTGTFTQMDSGYKSHFNSMNSIIGNGFPIPFPQSLNGNNNFNNIPSFLENMSQLDNTTNPLGLRMIGGAIRYLGAPHLHSPPENYSAIANNNFQSYSNYRPDNGALMPFQDLGFNFQSSRN